MKQLIWILGNMGSGKSTLCRELKKELPNYRHFNIDEYRHKYNLDNSMSGEMLAINNFYDDLEKTDLVLLESVGTYGSDLYRHEPIIIKLECSREVAEKRIMSRMKTTPPTPFPYLKEEERTIEKQMENWDNWEQLNKIKDRFYKYELVINTDSLTAKEIFNLITERLKMKETVEKIKKELDLNQNKINDEFGKKSNLTKEIQALYDKVRACEKEIARLKDQNEDLTSDMRRITKE